MKMYKDDSSMDESLIGSCTFNLKTMVTNKADGSFTPPSAAMTIGIVAGVLALGSLIWLYCTCCRRSKKVVIVESSSLAGTKRGSTTSYKKMEDECTLDTSKAGSKV